MDLSTTERAKMIRDILKKLGIKASVRSKYFSGGSSIDVTLKQWTSIEKINEIIKEHDDVRRDEYSGEILLGGNRYVNADFDGELLPTPEMVEQVKWAINHINFGEGFTPEVTKIHHFKNMLTEKYNTYDRQTWGHIIYTVMRINPEIRKEISGY